MIFNDIQSPKRLASGGTDVAAIDVAPAVLDTQSVHILNAEPSTIAASTSDNQPHKHHRQNRQQQQQISAPVVPVNNNGTTTTKPQHHHQHLSPSSSDGPAVIEIPIETAESGDGLPGTGVAANSNPGLRTIELSSGRVREGFGECIFWLGTVHFLFAV